MQYFLKRFFSNPRCCFKCCKTANTKSNNNLKLHFFLKPNKRQVRMKLTISIHSLDFFIYLMQMRSNRGHAKIRSKSYSNWLLINIFNSNLPVRSIVATISIQIRTQKVRIWAKIVNFSCRFRYKSSFSIKFDQFLI